MAAYRDAVPIGTVVTTDVPSRLDRLDWSGWHRRVVTGLGITWILDGLEAALIQAVAPALARPDTLHLSETQIGLASSVYLLGQVVGALFFGHLTDKQGRKKLFLVTLAVYLLGTLLSGAAPNYTFFLLFRFIAGAGIGGEYSAINSAIDELMPARVRGHVDLAIGGSYWVGVGMSGLLTRLLLNPSYVSPQYGWRLAFGLGAVMGLAILFVRRAVPESPRWLLLHGHVKDSEEVVDKIEAEIRAEGVTLAPAPKVNVKVMGSVGFAHIAQVLLKQHARRSVLGLVLMIAQTFFYNAIFFTYSLILTRFYAVPEWKVGDYLIPFAVGNFLGPVLLGRLFDTIGRRVMIGATYALSGILLILTGYLFNQGLLTASTQTLCWCVVFFFASAAASSAYLTVSELFPVELRGMAIALFYALSTAVGGVVAPAAFGRIVQSGSRVALFWGYIFGSVLMIIAAVVAYVMGVDAEGKSLEELAEPGLH